VLTGGEDTSMRLYDPASGKLIRRFKPDNGARLHALVFLPDGRRVVAGSDTRFLTFWSATRGRFLTSYEGTFPSVQLFAMAGDGLLAAGDERALRVWALPPADASHDVPPPTRADLAYFKSLIEDFEPKTPEELDELSELAVSGNVDDAGLAHLARLTNLEGLSITDAPRVRGNGLTALKSHVRLRRLSLARTAVGDAGLAHLEPLTRLESLNLAGTRVTSAGIAHLKPLASLKVLDLQGTPMADVVLQTLSDLPSLEHLDLGGTRIDDLGMPLFRGFKRLQTLNLRGSKVSEAEVADLRKAMPQLKVEFEAANP
jgi:hypothetical protein